MKKFNVTFYYHTNVTVTVDADNENEALATAQIEVCDEKYNEQILDGRQEDGSPDVEEVE